MKISVLALHLNNQLYRQSKDAELILSSDVYKGFDACSVAMREFHKGEYIGYRDAH